MSLQKWENSAKSARRQLLFTATNRGWRGHGGIEENAGNDKLQSLHIKYICIVML
jgi:hypothetical protein